MTVLAIDPGFGRLGVAIIKKGGSKEELVYSTCVVTPSSLLLPDRLAMIGSQVREIIKNYSPDCLVLEKLYFAKNKTTALKVAEVRGVILELAAQNNLQIFEYSPAEIKVAVTGYGAATKPQVESMVRKLIPLGDGGRIDDEIDAIAVGLTHLATAR